MHVHIRVVLQEILQHIAREGAEFKQNLENDIMLSKPADPVTSSLLPFADLSVEARRKQVGCWQKKEYLRIGRLGRAALAFVLRLFASLPQNLRR